VLDAVPAANRLDIGLNLSGPGDGFIAGLIGTDRPIVATVGGRGTGRAGRAGRAPPSAARASPTSPSPARDGTFTVDGPSGPAWS
jgi:translocation and assembly module TamB